MASFHPDPANPAQADAGSPVSPSIPSLTYRHRKRRHWLQRLATMPSWMYRECVERLLRGDHHSRVADWVLEHEDRGGISELALPWLTLWYGLERYAALQGCPGAVDAFISAGAEPIVFLTSALSRTALATGEEPLEVFWAFLPVRLDAQFQQNLAKLRNASRLPISNLLQIRLQIVGDAKR